ncbi:unnamed protein product [Macrosiphum euphorbiae]|uniref:Uncharacterized protein n=1 Tax=Macrosiphum euphorbiae TaxID=13131 RepID=A0AAV0VZG6_9HEMI|nr:unnamed protein product [Macrosiphum euphorbiae]
MFPAIARNHRLYPPSALSAQVHILHRIRVARITKKSYLNRKQTSRNRPIKLTVVPPATQRNVNSKSKRNLTYAKVTASVPSSDQSTDFITKCLEELKSILNPLLISLTTIINKFSLPVSTVS